MDHPLLLTKLPVELRLRIYEHLLDFDAPIKLRQVIPGSRNLAILRICRQIYEEAVSVLYDLNTVMVTRNDFCRRTDPILKTPLKLDRARHLLVTSFSQSIACTLSDSEERCSTCQPSATGFVRALTDMPRLQTVIVDYHNHVVEMGLLSDSLAESSVLELRPIATATGSHMHKLSGDGLEAVDVRFTCGRAIRGTLLETQYL